MSFNKQESLLIKNAKSYGDCISGNMLEFNSMQDFGGLTTELQKLPLGKAYKPSKLNEFTSQADYLESLEDQSELGELEIEEESAVYDPYLSSLINPEGEVKIGEHIYKLGNEYCFAYTSCEGKNAIPSFYNNLNRGEVNLREGQSINFNRDLIVFKVDKVVEEFTESRSSESDRYVFQNKRSVKGKLWEANWLVYKSSGAKTKMMKKKWGIWVKTKADEITVDWDVTFYNTLLNSPTSLQACDLQEEPPFVEYSTKSGSKTSVNSKKVSTTFYSVTGGGVTTGGGNTDPQQSPGLPYKLVKHSSFRNSLSDHNVVYNDGRHHTCTNYWKECPESTTNCSGGTSTEVNSNGGSNGGPVSGCVPACPIGYICVGTDCIQLDNNSCVPKCPPGEQCINGNCVPL